MTDKRKLQSLINKCAKYSTLFHFANKELCEYTRDQFGFEPGDVDADEIIDLVQGGCGPSTGMSADEYIDVMKKSIG